MPDDWRMDDDDGLDGFRGIVLAALVLGILAAKRNPLDVLAAGWLRLKEWWREWWK